MSDQKDPISPAAVAAHVLVMIILLIGSCFIEWIKRRWEPAFTTNALLGLGEGTMFLYIIGAIGKAFWWMVEQWTGDRAGIRHARASLLKQFVPTKLDIADVFRPGKVLRLIIVFVAALIIVLLFFEVTPMQQTRIELGGRRLSKTDSGILRSVEYRSPSSLWLLVAFFNNYSLFLLLTFAVLGGLTVLGILSIVLVQKRKTS
jgi:hypothetical protein